MTYTPRIRLFVDADLAPGAAVSPTDGQAHYLLHVMRAAAGDSVAVFNGRDGEWQAQVAYPAKRQVVLEVAARLRLQTAEPDLWLAFAPVKRIEFLVEKATELGVSALVPVMTRRTAIARVNPARLRSHCIEAAEQSDRLSVPELQPAAPFATVITSWPPARRLYFLDETGSGEPIADVLLAKSGAKSAQESAGFLTGPEGGFDQSELDALRQLPFATAVGLGPRILRAETAGLAAIACWQALTGDWRSGKPGQYKSGQ